MKYYEIEIEENKKVRGFLHHKDSQELVLVFHGFTGNKYDHHGMLRRFSETICRCGYNVFRFDFLGCGDSDYQKLSIQSQIGQGINLFDYFRSQGYRIHLFGFSLGAVIASQVAISKDIRSLFLLSPAGNFNEILTKMLDKDNEVNGFKIPDSFIEETKNTDFFLGIDQYHGFVKIVCGTNDQYVSLKTVTKYREFYPQAQLSWIQDADHCYGKQSYTIEVGKEIEKFYGKIKSMECKRK